MDKEHLSVLVIDDDAEIAELVQAILQQAGWSATICIESRNAVDLAQTIKPTLVLCDARMPGLTGPEIATLLKSNSGTAGIPVVLMTGYCAAEVLGTTDYAELLQKPFTPHELVSVLKRTVQRTSPPRHACQSNPTSELTLR